MDKYEQILDDCKSRMQSSLNNFNDSLKKIRTGRANPSMLDGILVDYYGTDTPLNQCCSITVEDSKTLSLTPWDKSLVQDIDRAIQKSDLGINPTVAGEVIRIIMPPLTEESRKDLTKKAKNEAENARIAIRNVRRDCITSMKNLEKGGELTEDDISDSEKDIQEITDNFSKQIDDTLESKEKDLLTI
ncbi:MAG: ribosome recycling factor [Gammaproteobacteria bacterium]|uniref:Ribosome-recycling factor n=1 Tax=SAR86 cluster bacterium TaxID=2030880 RepID=A0A520MY58_9GAMM|nr:ribosome recycling factor [Gammaproteobacteria bacterium]MBA4730283.1 ribosome recycling factor [SAR86 cluster bacterium]RPG35516.1 MAG: ribosome recycling factor [Gammaproteobacteria bacterium TMED193]RZO26158.1 MAG: ribosome recycling factor [SAR86 cluster bacterium]|tara:strand:+ start:460 stop:1023 length:564 start_codon:yes stop_codon:yes gene_type:complete